ncbi:phage tail protein [Methylobacterium sp. Gmos1]
MKNDAISMIGREKNIFFLDIDKVIPRCCAFRGDDLDLGHDRPAGSSADGPRLGGRSPGGARGRRIADSAPQISPASCQAMSIEETDIFYKNPLAEYRSRPLPVCVPGEAPPRLIRFCDTLVHGSIHRRIFVMEAMTGMIFMVPFDWAPDGYQKCQGQTLAIQQYQALYSLLGTLYGGTGTTTFGIPNLVGRSAIGTGVFPGSGTSYNIASQRGSETTTLTTNNLPPHTHAATFTPTTGSQAVNLPAVSGNLKVSVIAATAGTGQNSPAGNFLGSLTGANRMYSSSPTSTAALADGSTTVTGNPSIPAQSVNINTVTGGNVTIGTTGTGTAFSSFQPSLALTFIITMFGIYPSRP